MAKVGKRRWLGSAGNFRRCWGAGLGSAGNFRRCWGARLGSAGRQGGAGTDIFAENKNMFLNFYNYGQ